MIPMSAPSLSATEAWQPLPAAEWNAEAARHLLRRTGWTAQPADVARSLQDGLPATLDRLFPEAPPLFPKPALIAHLEAGLPGYAQRIRAALPEERRQLQREERERAQATLLNLTIRWLQFAVQPENAAYAKWVLFLSDIYVVSFAKVYNPPMIYRHFDILGRAGLGPAPALTKAVSRSPAMIQYLDLNQSRKGAPNENFAREMMELFVLGEGHYAEADIKEAARAFTGYRTRPAFDDFIFAAGQHDDGPKTVFGRTGNFTGDQVIDLAYGLPAAGAFLPHELAKFYLSDTPLPAEHVASLGRAWSTEGDYSLRWLAGRFFGSRLFFAPEFRADFIKSPVQFYLGLVQDLGLDVTPIPRFVVNPLRQMGQVLYQPPNVRGWVGGRSWIDAGTLAARRALTEQLFTALDEAKLNADEQEELVAARARGQDRFTVTAAGLSGWARLNPDECVARLSQALLPAPPTPAFRAALQDYLAAGPSDPAAKAHRLRRTIATLIESPEYQLC
jgi:uncharacterized protein (DUF1800 family)